MLRTRPSHSEPMKSRVNRYSHTASPAISSRLTARPRALRGAGFSCLSSTRLLTASARANRSIRGMVTVMNPALARVMASRAEYMLKFSGSARCLAVTHSSVPPVTSENMEKPEKYTGAWE